MGANFFKEHINRDKIRKILIFFLTYVVIFVVLATSTNLSTKKYYLQEGDIAKEDIKAQREIVDQASTAARVTEAENSIPLQYNKRVDEKNEAINDINQLFSNIITEKASTVDDKVKLAYINTNSSIKLSEASIAKVLKLSLEDVKDFKALIIKAISDLYDNNNIDDSQANTQNSSESLIKAKESFILAFTSDEKYYNFVDIGTSISNSEIKPNFFYDKESTFSKKKLAGEKVPPVLIKKDQIVVKEGEPVTSRQLEILNELGLINSKGVYSWYLYISLAVLVFLILFIQWFYLRKNYKDIYSDWKKLLLINILTLISIILARTLSIISPFLIPLACTPMLMTLLVNERISLTFSTLNCILISASIGFQLDITIIAFFNAILGALILKKMQQRNEILYSSLTLAILNILLLISMGFILSSNFIEVLMEAVFAFISVIISAVLTIGLIPYFENIFDIVTTMKLLELSNPNSPLLKRLLLEAPGTYHHSILVANIAEVAAEEIGASPILTRVGAYYHDIGKIIRPYFFTENQFGNNNPHNTITPNLSTLIITSHIKDGLELAKEYKLPIVIQDIIQQHHGTSLVKYFYVTMKNSSEKPEEVREEDFRYLGPIPLTKEAGVVMLADCAEASVRSINDPTKGKIDEMVNNIIKNILNEGQLDDCDLTLKDIYKIRKSFLKSFSAIYHSRIEYPTENWNKRLTEVTKKLAT